MHDWLRQRKAEQALPEQPLQLSLDEGDQESREPQPLELLSQQLLDEIPDLLPDDSSTGPRGFSWRVQRLLAELLPFHHREAKVSWWAYFDRRSKAELSPVDLIDDGEAIAEARWVGMEERSSARTGADIHHFRFDPTQPLNLHAGGGDGRLTVKLPASGLKLDVDALDGELGTLSLKLPWSKRDQRISNGEGDGIPKGPTSVIKVPADISKSLRERLEEQAMAWVHENKPIPQAILQLLERRPLPELKALNAAIEGDPNGVAGSLAAFLKQHSGISLALQGPPGTGKTTVTSQVIAQLVAGGQRIAISSNSHAAINNLLKKAKSTCITARLGDDVVKCSNSKEDALTGDEILL